jgi:hypothetical protein
VEQWGAALYGNPCRECGFGWELTPEQAIASVREVPGAYAARLAGATGRERHPDLAWTAAAYVCHVTDNLRTWAERLAGGYLAADLAIAGYDPDLLSQARRYDEVSLAGALWSLRWAAIAWSEAAETALAAGLVLQHATRGAQRAEDVARNNAHDARHHLWDIARIVAQALLWPGDPPAAQPLAHHSPPTTHHPPPTTHHPAPPATSHPAPARHPPAR